MVNAQLSEAEIARRLPVWTALSDLFRDTEMVPHDYRRIAEVIRQGGFSHAEAESIFRNEVAPAFAQNFWSVAGEWQGWPEDFVRDRVLAKRGSRLSKTITLLVHGKLLREEWALIMRHLG